MWATIIFVLALAGLGIYLWQMQQAKKLSQPDIPSGPMIDRLSLDNVGAGGMIHLMNVGKNMEEYDVNILSRSIYREGDNHDRRPGDRRSGEWYELEGDNGKQKLWISLEDDDMLNVTLAMRKLKLRDLPISRDDLDDMDEKNQGEFVFEGKTYYYENSNEASYFRNSDTTPDNEAFFYYWKFEDADGTAYITIEEWENGRFEVIVSAPIKASQVKVYSLGS